VGTHHASVTIDELERVAVLRVLHDHPEWPIGAVLAYVENGGAKAETLRGLTLAELVGDADTIHDRQHQPPPIGAGRLLRAQTTHGAQFDRLVLVVLLEARPREVAAGYLRARLGGPRWKLTASLNRLVLAGMAVRSGNTSGTRYGATGMIGDGSSG
jgi:hypothetical protein